MTYDGRIEYLKDESGHQIARLDKKANAITLTSYDCLDAFGGGAVFITAEATRQMSTGE